MVIIPGYCVQGTVGNKILSGNKEVDIEHKLVKVTPAKFSYSGCYCFC